jgi:hypothetical protein
VLQNHNLEGISVSIQLGPYDDSEIDLVVKAENISLDIQSVGSMSSGGKLIGPGISMKEASNAKRIKYWPNVSIQDTGRRRKVYEAARSALDDAVAADASSVGFYTLSLEVSRVPSWEVAEEIVKAIIDHSKQKPCVERVFLIASSPIQVSSFQFALDNFKIFADV